MHLDYTVVFKAEDNYLDSTGLATLKTLRIRVVAPPPQDVVASKEGNSIIVSWEKPYFCEVTANDYLQGFSVWRRVNSNPFVPDSCETGLDGKGYQQIAYDVLDMQNGRYFFRDDFVEKGKTYCYRVLAEFALISPGGNPFNRVKSIPSMEICTQLNRDLPFITHVDVTSTDSQNGSIHIRWQKPVIPDLDTSEFTGPYRFELERASGIGGTDFNLIPDGTFEFEDFSSPDIDTAFIHAGINTIDGGHNYRIKFFVQNGNLYGTSQTASSVFQAVTSSDRRNSITWSEIVPWQNYRYDIFKENASGTYDSIGTTTSNTFIDRDVENNEEYCYLIKALGTYGISGIPSPQLNFSQIACGTPVDTVAPCAPDLIVNNICNDIDPRPQEDELLNHLTWIISSNSCDRENDIAAFRVYFSANIDGTYEQIAQINGCGS